MAARRATCSALLLLTPERRELPERGKCVLAELFITGPLFAACTMRGVHSRFSLAINTLASSP